MKDDVKSNPFESNGKAIGRNENDCNLLFSREIDKVFICDVFNLKSQHSAPKRRVFINDKTRVLRAIALIKWERHVANFLCEQTIKCWHNFSMEILCVKLRVAATFCPFFFCFLEIPPPWLNMKNVLCSIPVRCTTFQMCAFWYTRNKDAKRREKQRQKKAERNTKKTIKHRIIYVITIHIYGSFDTL